ncbi:MAG: site-specific integrase [Planctomycetota bacterium]|nr:site-specific integrase [Planctomycetota bacterium]
MQDVTAWLQFRYQQQRKSSNNPSNDHFVCSLQRATFGTPLNRHVVRRRFLTACKPLGLERLRTLTIHHGRHTFISHALAGGRTLAEVKAAAGHGSLMTTSLYLHVAVEEERGVGRLFEMGGVE